MFNTIAKLLTIGLLVLLVFERRSHRVPEDAEGFHQGVEQAVRSIPSQAGEWEGAEVSVPEPAQRLLRPSAYLAREYFSSERKLGGQLVIVHCRDVRDLSGHYPPRCYPAHGWRPAAIVEDALFEVDGLSIPLRRYEFTREGFEVQDRMVVYGTFILPRVGCSREMSRVQEVAGNYRQRVYGASQLQVIFTGAMARSEEEQVVREFLGMSAGVIRTISDPA